MQEILTIRDLCKSFDSLSVLEHIDLTIKKGEVAVICRKRTIIRVSFPAARSRESPSCGRS